MYLEIKIAQEIQHDLQQEAAVNRLFHKDGDHVATLVQMIATISALALIFVTL